MENKHWKKNNNNNNNNNNEKARGATTELRAGLGRVIAAPPSNITKKIEKQWKTIFFRWETVPYASRHLPFCHLF